MPLNLKKERPPLTPLTLLRLTYTGTERKTLCCLQLVARSYAVMTRYEFRMRLNSFVTRCNEYADRGALVTTR